MICHPVFGLLGVVGAGLLVSAPALLPVHAEPLLSFYPDWLAFVFGLAAAIPVLLVRRGESIPVPGMALGLFGLAAVIALQVAIGRVTFVETGATGILYTAWAGLLVIAGARLREIYGVERIAFVLQCAFAIGGLLMAVTGFMQYYKLKIGQISIAAEGVQGMVGAVGQQNYFALIVGCGVASWFTLAVRGKVWPELNGLATVAMIAALAFSGSRSVVLFLLVMIVVAAICGQRQLRGIAIFGAVLFAAITCAIGAGWIPLPSGQTMTAAGRIADTATAPHFESTRKVLAMYAWEMFTAHPLLGAGFNEFALNAFMAAPDLGVRAPVPLDKHAHNLVLQLMAETGAIGAACILAPLALWFINRCTWNVRPCGFFRERLRTSPDPSLATCWIFMVVLMHLAQAMLELPHWYAYLLGPFALMLGLGSPNASRLSFPTWWRFAPRALLVIAIAAASVRLADYRALERWVAEVAALQGAGRPLPDELLGRLEQLDATIFAPEVELMAAQVPATGDPALRLALNTRAMHVFPLPVLAQKQIELLRLTGRETEADAIERAFNAVWRGR